MQLAAEDEKFKSWKDENIRRRHNYVPFIMGMLKTLAARGHLVRLLEEGKSESVCVLCCYFFGACVLRVCGRSVSFNSTPVQRNRKSARAKSLAINEEGASRYCCIATTTRFTFPPPPPPLSARVFHSSANCGSPSRSTSMVSL